MDVLPKKDMQMCLGCTADGKSEVEVEDITVRFDSILLNLMENFRSESQVARWLENRRWCGCRALGTIAYQHHMNVRPNVE